MTFHNVLRCCLSLGLLLAAGGVFASEPMYEFGQALPDGRITAELPSATALNLTLRGVWRDACTPGFGGFVGTGHRRLLVLNAGPVDRVCAQVLTPFELEVPGVRFDAEDAGLVEVALIEAGSGWLATTTLSVQPELAASARFSLYNVAGGWHDADTPGSGLILSHHRAGTVDRVAGVWTNFDPDGSSRTYLLADAHWATPTQLLGVVYRAQSASFACTLQSPNHECDFGARAAESLERVAVFELRLADAHSALLTLGDPTIQGVPPPGSSVPAVTGCSISLQRL